MYSQEEVPHPLHVRYGRSMYSQEEVPDPLHVRYGRSMYSQEEVPHPLHVRSAFQVAYHCQQSLAIAPLR